MKSRQDFITDAEWWEYYRQYTAAMAMQGIIAAHNIYETGIDNEVNANTAVRAADALINALNKQQ